MADLICIDPQAEAFASVSSGWGSGWGSGFGLGSGWCRGSDDGCGWCRGSGLGSGSGSDDGWGFGSDDGLGYGSGGGYGELFSLGAYCGSKVYNIDDVPTLIDVVFGSYAKGRILMDDMTTRVCYIARDGNTFAHGYTLHKAQQALTDKLFDDMSVEDRITAFLDTHNLTDAYPNRDLFDWHHKLTGSCLAGRNAFVANHGIDMDGSTTVTEFIALCEHDYGRDVIKLLKQRVMEVDGDG